MLRHLAAIGLRAEHDCDAGKAESDAEQIAARQLLAAENRRDDQGLDRDGGNADRAARRGRVLQRRAESPGKKPKNNTPITAMVTISAAGTRTFGQTKGNTGTMQIVAMA